MVEEWAGEQVRDALVSNENDRSAFGFVNRWLTRGEWVAVYENADLGHRDVGMLKFTSYGSAQAQLERTQFPDGPPQTLPDIGGAINWPYQLKAICKTGPVPLPS